MVVTKGKSGSTRAWAHFRFGVVGRLLALPPTGDLQDEIEQLAAKVWPHPTRPGEQRTFGYSTIERWYYEARTAADPIAALSRKVRSDAGREKALTVRLTEELGRQYGAHPSWSYPLHHDNLVVLVAADPEKYGVEKAPSYPTVRRAMQRRGWVRRRVPRRAGPRQRRLEQVEQRERRSFEAPAVHALWHYDFHQARRRVVDPRGSWQDAYLLGVLDDCSRVNCHLQWYLSESAENVVHGLEQAFCKRGLPRSILHDGGSAMLAIETLGGLKRLAIVSMPTLPYSPEQNGKQEVFWGQVEGRLMAMLEKVEPLTLEFLNRATAAWVEGDYNHKVHEELGCTPIERMLRGPDVSRPPFELEPMRLAFTRQEERTQRRSDGTVSIDGVRFELPSRLRTLRRPTMRWRSWDLSVAWVVDSRTEDATVLAKVHPLDKEANARRGRRGLEPVLDAAAPTPPPSNDPVPPLLRKLMADYAATGLPPAYLPKDEHLVDVEADDDEP